jgi:hypothetical protein
MSLIATIEAVAERNDLDPVDVLVDAYSKTDKAGEKAAISRAIRDRDPSRVPSTSSAVPSTDALILESVASLVAAKNASDDTDDTNASPDA